MNTVAAIVSALRGLRSNAMALTVLTKFGSSISYLLKHRIEQVRAVQNGASENGESNSATAHTSHSRPERHLDLN
jgi:hypothetical protein